MSNSLPSCHAAAAGNNWRDNPSAATVRLSRATVIPIMREEIRALASAPPQQVRNPQCID